MNMKKKMTVALAAAMVVSSMAVSVSVAAVGGSDNGNVAFTVDVTNDAVVSANLDSLTAKSVEVTVPAGTLPTGDYTMVAQVVADVNLANAFDAQYPNDLKTFVEISFQDAQGNKVNPAGATIKFTITDTYDSAFVVEADNSFKKLEATATDTSLTTKGPHFSTYVIADLKDEQNSNDNQNSGKNGNQNSSDGKGDSNGNGTNTGDSATTTLTVFGVMGLVALGTAVVSSKMKKTEE